MHDLALVAATALLSYLIGAIPFGYLIARWHGVDILAQGSGNIGATNVGRVLGRRLGILVFVLDFLKGALPALAATLVSRSTRPDLPPNTLPVTAGVSAFLGHLFPVYLRFRGGKGVATGAGVVAVLVPLPTFGALLTWVVLATTTRYVSFASLCATVVLCALRLGLTPAPFSPENRVLTLFCFLATAVVFLRHQANIRRLLAGKENRLEDSPAMLTLTKILHVLSLGLWFGTAIFFSFVVGFVLFGTFEKVATQEERPAWFPLAREYAGNPPSPKFPDPLRKEQGTRAAGHAISPLFDWYFIIQAVCAVVALVTALGWSSSFSLHPPPTQSPCEDSGGLLHGGLRPASFSLHPPSTQSPCEDSGGLLHGGLRPASFSLHPPPTQSPCEDSGGLLHGGLRPASFSLHPPPTQSPCEDSGGLLHGGLRSGPPCSLRRLRSSLAGAPAAGDWPQLFGPQRNAHSSEKGLVNAFPGKGPSVVWQKEVGDGYAGPVVAGGKLILFHRLGDKDVVECLDAATGKQRWRFDYATAYSDRLGKGDGPRATPLIDGKRVYTLAADGRLHCLNIDTGKKLWMRSLNKDYRVPPSYFGVGTSPIIEGDNVVVNVGGQGGIVALNRLTGKEAWKATHDPASYASPVAATVAGKRRLFFFTRTGLEVLDPATGQVIHSKRWRATYDASVNAASPVVVGDEVFISTCYETGGTVLRLGKSGLQSLWANDESLSTHYSTSVEHKGFLYGFHGRQEQGTEFRCVDWKTGKVRWSKKGFGCGSIILADGKLIVFSEDGDLVLVEPTPAAYREKARAKVLDGPVRAQPALANGLLYARDNKKLVCWKLTAGK
jgi:outer membrane protein assembly factor BamB